MNDGWMAHVDNDWRLRLDIDTSKLDAALQETKPEVRRYWRKHPIRYIRFKLWHRKQWRIWRRLSKFFSGGKQ